MIERLNKREQSLLIITSCASIIWFFASYIIGPLDENNMRLNDMIRSKTVQYWRLEKLIVQKNRFSREFSELTRLNKTGLSEETDNAGFLKVIDQIQKKTGTQIENITPIEPEFFSLYKRLKVKAEISDKMENIIKFIAELQSTPERLNLVNLLIVPGQGDNLKASLTIAELIALK